MSEKNRRLARVEKTIRQVISEYVLMRYKGEMAGLVSIPSVQVSPDLRFAKVYVSVLGEPEDTEYSLQELQNRAPELQKEIAKHMRSKYCPKLTFMEDQVTQQMLKVDTILHNLKQEKENADSSDSKESYNS